MTLRPQSGQSAVSAALKDVRRAFWAVGLFSALVNILMLAGPLYMLQIYDRVLSSRSVPTLVALSIGLVGAYAFQGVLEAIRSRIVVRSAGLVDERLDTVVHRAVIHLGTFGRNPGEAHQPMRDLDQVRAFLNSPGPTAIVDLPWVPIFLMVCALIHPWLGAVGLVGAFILLSLTFLTERASREPARAVTQDHGLRAAMMEAGRRNSETIFAMSMTSALADRWSQVNRRYLATLARSTDVIGSYGAASKMLRMLLQSAMLGFGAYLVIRNELTAGGMIAASIMMGRALAPIETAIANWRGFIAARQGLRHLTDILGRIRRDPDVTALPKPTRTVDIEDLTVAAPGMQSAIVSRVNFRLQAGEALGIIGPSASGKSSLVRTLVGVWPVARGSVRFDGAALSQYDPDQRGSFIGYVSQNVELFDGTIAENIARMSATPDAAAVLAAAKAAGAHEMILRLPGGYDTRIGEGGAILSGGQRQRIALARALFGEPFFVVLDEPGANLDSEGEAALQQAIRGLKERGAVVVLIAHRPTALANCDKVLFLAGGMQQAFGPRDEVMRKLMARPVPPAAAAANLKVVGEPAGGADR